MRKISLNVSSLQVESFETADDKAKERGTVQGHASWYTCPLTMCGADCLSGPNPCQPSAAWTDGMVACLCNDTSRCP
jgi:hypothetical protein